MRKYRSEYDLIFKSHPGFLRLLSVFYIVLLGGLVILGILFYENNKAFNKGTALVTQTRIVIGHTDSILLLSQNLQWTTRNYTLTGDPNSYREYVSIRDSIQRSVKVLIQLVRDNQYQQANTTKLQQQITELIQFTDNSLELRQVPGDIFKRFITNVNQHIKIHNAINTQIKLIKAEENRVLALRRANVYKTIDSTNRIFIASGIITLILLAGTFVFVFYHYKKRRKAEINLIESEQRFQTLINSTKDLAIFMINDKGCIIDWSSGAHNIKGYEKEDVIGKSISIFYTPESIAAGEVEHNLQIAAEQGSFETEGWRVRKDGSRFWADVLITAVYDEERNLKGFTKVTRDFSLHKKAADERQNAFEKEKELNEMKSNFVSIASHEFRTPLATILSSVSLLEQYKTTDTQDKRDKHIQRIKSSVKEMVSILEEFLSLEKIEEGKVEVKKELFNLKELTLQAEVKFNTLLKPGQEIELIHTGREVVYLDAGFMLHIVNNLLSNAIKYSPEATQLLIETHVNEAVVTLKVKDHGIGISPEDQKHLFERFYRASNTGNIKGTGLGLHIVKRYIDLMDGTIEVNSEVGEGSQFTVVFPSESQ